MTFAPLVADDHRHRIEASTAAAHVRWMELLGALVRRFGHRVVATASTPDPDVQWMQHVVGLTPDDAALVPEIMAWYRDLGIRPRFEIAPSGEFGPLAAALAGGGARQTGFTDVLFGSPQPPVVTSDVEVREVGTDDGATFGRIMLAGHEVPGDARPEHHRAAASFPGQTGYRCYLAYVGDEPVGQAILIVNDGVGLLANASVIPDGRRRGAQQALINRRIADALTAGCDLVATTAVPGGGSHRNLERAGLRVAYTKVIWTMVE